jgi:hypothetical protein
MSDEGKQLECVADEFGLKRLYPRSRLFTGSGTIVRDKSHRTCAVQPSSLQTEKSAKPEIEACEFAVGLIVAGSENRICVCGCFCEATIFKNSKVYAGCDIRKEKLAEQT